MPAPYSRARPPRDPLHARRTIIPILLTTSGLLFIGAICLLLAGPDSALPDVFPGWTAFALLLVSLCSGALGALNVVSVRNALRDGPGPR